MDVAEAVAWLQALDGAVAAERSPAHLTALGVDVIQSSAEFVRRPMFGLRVGPRLLRSRRFLLATGTYTVMPPIPGLVALSPMQRLTPEALAQPQLWTKLASRMPQQIALLGDGAIALAWAQIWARLGATVTLICPDGVLPHADREVAARLVMHLEADGIQVLAHRTVMQVQSEGDRLQLKTNHRANDEILDADALLVTLQQPQVEGLNLEGIRLQSTPQLPQNSRQQTANSRIYALSGNPQMARYEAQVAVQAALAVPWQPRWRRRAAEGLWISQVVPTDPPLAQVGLTEEAARQRWGDRTIVMRQSLNAIPKAHLRQRNGGICKLILRPNGQLVGAHILAAEAEEWIGIVALAMQQRLSLTYLASGAIAPLAMAEVLHQAAIDWHQHHQQPLLLALYDCWFDGLRTRSR
jgi:pyruvate/2-oxoglutarate dehydrogenase complex dihydrolipoamide dehydrogenase (E3) component